MKVSLKAVVTSTYKSKKSNREYLSLVDLSNGAIITFATDGVPAGVVQGKTVQIEAEVYVRSSREYGQSLSITSGEIKPL